MDLPVGDRTAAGLRGWRLAVRDGDPPDDLLEQQSTPISGSSALGYRYTELLVGDRSHEVDLDDLRITGTDLRVNAFDLCNAFGTADSGPN